MRLVLRGQEGVLLRQVAQDIREHSGPLPQGDGGGGGGDDDGDDDDDDDAQGELHLTESVCPKDFVGELQYWGLSALYLEPCCAYTLQRASWLLPVADHGVDKDDQVWTLEV